MSSGSASGDKGTGAAQQAASKEDYGVIVDEFGKRMGVLRKVLDAGLERQRKVSAATTHGDGVGDHEMNHAPGAEPADASDSAAADDNNQQDPPQRQADASSQRQSSNDGGGAAGD